MVIIFIDLLPARISESFHLSGKPFIAVKRYANGHLERWQSEHINNLIANIESKMNYNHKQHNCIKFLDNEHSSDEKNYSEADGLWSK